MADGRTIVQVFRFHVLTLFNLRYCFLAIPHRVDTDDTYKGYFIPKHSTVLANVWCVKVLLLYYYLNPD